MPADCNPLRVLLLHHCAHHLGWGAGQANVGEKAALTYNPRYALGL